MFNLYNLKIQIYILGHKEMTLKWGFGDEKIKITGSCTYFVYILDLHT